MHKRNILITGIGGDIGQSIIKCLKATNYEIFLVGCDIDPYASGRKNITKFIIAPEATKIEEYYKFICGAIENYAIKYIYPSTEQEIIFFDKYRDYFDKKDITVFINSSFILNSFLDKYKTVNFLREKGIPYPDTYLVTEYKDQLIYPFVMKSRKGSGGRTVIKINNSDEFNFYKKRINDAIVQEYLGDDNEEYTTGVFSDGNNIFSITFKRKLGHGGWSKIVELTIDNKVSNLAEKIARYSNLVGAINIQTRRTTKGFIVFEINPRFSSTVYFRYFFGFRDVKWWLDLIEGKKIEFKLKYKRGIGVRAFTEVFFNLYPKGR